MIVEPCLMINGRGRRVGDALDRSDCNLSFEECCAGICVGKLHQEVSRKDG
jgi:hypothetical protein